ncbi:MAG TPA: autotransporter-associated beta strand repeat-containing protein [Candidatus Acidoferrum sp.]|nr:autotransporter-associated beta strand repeat-containing protein [Candidatus Acidoferrum sp.]
MTESSGITITNAVDIYNKYSPSVSVIGSTQTVATLNLVATPAGVNFSGPWFLSGGSGWSGANIYATNWAWGNYTALNLAAGHGTGDNSDLINISGKLLGQCALTKLGSGILELSGDNSAFSGPLAINNGTLRVNYPTALGCDGAISTNGTITLGSAIFNSTNTYGTLDLNGYAVDAALVLGGTGNAGNGVLVNSNLDSTAVLNAPNGVLAALITSPFVSTTIATPVTVSVTGGGGGGATAIASLGVTANSFTVTPNTQKYNVMPFISISGGGGSNAIVAIPLSGAAGTVVGNSAFVTAPGLGYTSNPTSVSVIAGTTTGSGTKPAVAYNPGNFQLTGIQITSPGSGYTSPPTITVSGTGVDATGAAQGLISSVTLTNNASIGGPGNININCPIWDGGSGYGLTKLGAGTVSLGAVNAYSGATTVTGGKLVGVVGGSSVSSAVEVQTGTTLGVSIPDNTKQWTCASLAFDDSTTTSEFNFGSLTPSTTQAPLNVTGPINFSGTPTVSVLVAGSVPAGTYPLMTAAGGFSGTVPTTANLSLPPYISATLSSDANNLYLVVSGDNEPIKWALNGNGAWDINTTANWKDNTGTSVKYQQSAATPPVGDSVVLDDTYISTSPAVTLNATVTPVAVTVNSTHNYTIAGTGGIAGETGLSQQGSGTLELDTVNTYTGGTTIAAPGALTVGGAGQLGGGVYSAPIVNNGTLNYNSSAAQTLSGPVSGSGALAQGNGTLILSGANTYSGGTTIAGPATLQIGDGVLYNGPTVVGNIVDNGSLVFANFYPQTFTGNLSGAGSLTAAGATSLTLSGNLNSYSGGIAINVGSLIVNNAAAQTLSGVITGGGTLVQNGPGMLTLNATTTPGNTYSGGTIINAGILSVSAIDNSGFAPNALGSGQVTLGGAGATLQYTGTGTAPTLANTVSGTGTLDLPDGDLEVDVLKGTVTKTGSATLTLGGTADNSGLGMTINGGKVVLNKASSGSAHALGGATTTVNSPAILQLAGTGGDQIYSGGSVVINSGAVFDANGQTEGMTSLTLYGNGSGSGPLINSSGTAATITTTASPGGFVLGSNIGFASSGNITLAGVITNLNGTPYGITNAGPGTLTLNSVNRFSGGLTINAGATVVLNNYSAAGTNDTITINGNGILQCNAGTTSTTTYTNPITGGSTSAIKVTTASGNTYLGGDLSAFTGTIYCNGGQTVIGVANNAAHPISASATWNIANGATLDLQTPYVTDAASVIVNGVGANSDGCLRLDACNQTGPVLLTTNTATIGNGNASPGTISGVISDGGNNYGFTKTGTAANQTLVLSAANTYTGPTTNTIGTLEISGSIKGDVTVTGGTNQFDNATAMAATATLNLVTAPLNGAVNLNYSGTMTIKALNFGATSMAQGTWGAIGSAATHQHAAFSGTGLLNVTSGGTPTTTVLGSIPSTVCFGAPLNLTATVTGGSNGDTVQFLDGVTVLGTGTLSSGVASYSTSSLALGPHSITAHYVGSNIANPSTSSPAAAFTVSTCVAKASVMITSIVNNGDGTVTIKYTGGAGASFTLMESAVLSLTRDSWTPVGANNPGTPGSFTFTPSGNSFYSIRSN